MSSERTLVEMARSLALVLVLACGCFVDRKSEDLRCDTTGDCASGRDCVNGYCVVGGNPGVDASCPPQCTSCNAAAMTCTVAGNGNDVACPIGWSCNITCGSANACGTISCGAAASCTIACSSTSACGAINCGTAACTVTCGAANACGDVTCQTGACNVMCSAGNACGDIRCGVGRCDVTCGAGNACGDISCAASCACDVACPTGNCGMNTCPINGIDQCTATGSGGAPCSSTFVAGCSRC